MKKLIVGETYRFTDITFTVLLHDERKSHVLIVTSSNSFAPNGDIIVLGNDHPWIVKAKKI